MPTPTPNIHPEAASSPSKAGQPQGTGIPSLRTSDAPSSALDYKPRPAPTRRAQKYTAEQRQQLHRHAGVHFMTNLANLARQIAAYAQAHPDQATPLLEYLAFQTLSHTDPDAVQQLIPAPDTTMGTTLCDALRHLALERETTTPLKR